MNLHTHTFKKTIIFFKHFVFYVFLFAILLGFIYLNFSFKVNKTNYDFFDNNPENLEIKTFLDNLIRKNSSNFFSYISLDSQTLTEELHREFPIVASVNISKSFSLDLNVLVKKNEKFFYTCMPVESSFLVKCMLGNTDGEYYSGVDGIDFTHADLGLVKIELNSKVLYDVVTEKKIEDPDSLSGSRILSKEDFKKLREILRWVQKNGFKIEKVYVDELKIVDIYTDFYKIKISLDKGYVETVKDFETISRTGALQKYILEDKEQISYIDISYKDKVFYKLKKDEKTESFTELKNATNTDIMSTTSTTTLITE